MAPGAKESTECCREFLQEMKRRGLSENAALDVITLTCTSACPASAASYTLRRE